MNRLKIIFIWVFVTTMVSAMSIGCTTGPENKSDSNKNHETEIKSVDDGY
ncbi:MAG: hypothetical protein ACJZ45_07155 [Nitrospinia bacterium]|jgi:hypothetical protein|tara:strand:- start:1499 stop:1648 length:150 start_codon:yes stop_codon:yes gene_type:complete